MYKESPRHFGEGFFFGNNLNKFIITFLLCTLPLWAGALEYLSDSELKDMGGYTSGAMQKKYSDQGEVKFSRGDDAECQIYRSDGSEYRVDCEGGFEDESQQLVQQNFLQILDGLGLLGPERPVSYTDGESQFLSISVQLNDFDYNHFRCDGSPEKGVIRLEGMSLLNSQGGPVVLGPMESRIENQVVNGEVRRVIYSKLDGEIDGRFEIKAIKISSGELQPEKATSLGGIVIGNFSGRVESQILVPQAGDNR